MANAFSGSPQGITQGQQEQEADNDQWKPGPGGILIPKTPRPAQYASNGQHMLEAEEANTNQPVATNREGWKRYWSERGQPWRWEPEITKKRQEELEQRREIQADWKQGIYPFSGMTLTRADIEWLLATHERGRGPIEWDEKAQRTREGLDLRGVRVEEHTNLSSLPLAKIYGGLNQLEQLQATEEQCQQAALDVSWTRLDGAKLEGVSLGGAKLEGAAFIGATLEEAYLVGAKLEGAAFIGATLERADLTGTNLGGAAFIEAKLEGAYLTGTNLESACLIEAKLEGAYLAEATLADSLGIGPVLTNVHWGETSLTVLDWSSLRMLRNENYARQKMTSEGEKKDPATRHREYQDASRANHQLAVVLQDQGLTDDAARFAYRAKCLRRKALWHEFRRKGAKKKGSVFGSLLFSWFLFLLAGYGYRLRWCLLWPIGLVIVFMLIYWGLDPINMPWWVALGESVNVFHGRGAAPNIATLAHPVWFTAFSIAEAIIGLIIETVFIATVLQRLFGK